MEEPANKPIQEVSPVPTSVNKISEVSELQKDNKKIFIFLGLGVILIILLVIGFLLFKSTNKNIVNSPNTTTTTPPAKNSVTSFSPKIKFSSYALSANAKLPQIGTSISSYSLKTGFSEADAVGIGSLFGLTNITSQQNGFLVSNTSEKEKLGLLVFDKRTGSIQAQFNGTQIPPGGVSGLSVEQNALATLQAIGVADPSVDCEITYKLTTTPGITYVECHRSWQRLGLPLVDFVGVMNMSINDDLTKARPGAVYPDTLTNSTVINVSNGGAGKARPNGFNTATVGIRQDGTIASIDSNLRWIISNQQIATQDLITSSQAITLATKRKAELNFSVPSPNQVREWSKIYPNKTANAKSATVDEILLVYLEKPAGISEKTYEPYYLIRGTAFLDSGYAVKYAQAVSAQKSNYLADDLIALPTGSAEVSDGGDTLQLKNVIPVFEEPPTVSTDSPPPTVQSLCTQEALANNPNDAGWAEPGGQYPESVEIPGYGTVGVRLHNAPNGLYIVSLSNGQPIDAARVAAEYAKIVPGGQLPSTGSSGCFITAISPAIFLYPEQPINVNVKLGNNVVFSYPYALNNEWNVSVRSDGSMKSGDYLYYEYDSSKSSFSIPESGYVVKRSGVVALVNSISNKLGLTEKEEQILLGDASRALSLVEGSSINIGLASKTEINKNLPLVINPKPDVLHRINLTFSETDKNMKVAEPVLKPLIRTGFTAVEVGVSISR